MRSSRLVWLMLMALSILGGVMKTNSTTFLDNGAPRPNGMSARDGSAEAKKLWEMTIAAKGGREKLHSVSNMWTSASLEYSIPSKGRNRVLREALFVFPNKYWLYEDYGRDVFGIRLDMWDYDARTHYSGAPDDAETNLEPIRESKRNAALDNGQLFVLLETRWLKPVPLKVTTGRIQVTDVDIVETLVNGRQVDYALDKVTHLPLRVSFYDSVNGKTYIFHVMLSDYVAVNGISVPTKVRLGDGTLEKSVTKFNVNYDPLLFTRPPTSSEIKKILLGKH
jgi:hypothetical protein